ncbi:hypothetical protein ACIBTP_38100 [Streptomyces avidinii]|uniref:hypothetical protein n=1 Tax=Streptomyces avidinii TaxID=1895 RepID=UPI0037B120B3
MKKISNAVRLVTVAETEVLLVRMSGQQVSRWNWIGDMWVGDYPFEGHEVRDTTGALLGVILLRGHLVGSIHVEWYDPQADDFFAAGETHRVLTAGIFRVLEARERHVGPVPAGGNFIDSVPRFLWRRTACYLGQCDDCPECQADDERRYAASLAR